MFQPLYVQLHEMETMVCKVCLDFWQEISQSGLSDGINISRPDSQITKEHREDGVKQFTGVDPIAINTVLQSI